MKTLILALALFSWPAVMFAEETDLSGPDSLVRVAPEELRKLEAMHAEAERRIAGGDMRGAIAVYWDIILLEPDDDVAYTNLGHLYLILGDTDRAKDAFQNALHIDPENEDAQAGFLKITHPDEFPS